MTSTPSHKVRTFAFITAAAVSLVLIPLQGARASVKSSSWVPKDPPSIYQINAWPNVVNRRDAQSEICTTDAQLDCLESVEAFIDNAWVKGILTGREGYINENVLGTSEWRIAGLVNEDTKDLVEVRNQISYNGNIVHSIDIIATSIDNYRRPWESGLTSPDCARIGESCVRYGNLQENIPFRVTYRSSWVLPTALSSKLSNTKLTVEKLPQSGATRVTIEGTPLEYVGVADNADVARPDGIGAWISREFMAGMIDGRFYQRIKRDCIEQPTLTVSNNAYGYALPEFADGKLDLMVESTHFRPNGIDKHLGIYEAFIPFEMAQCLWGSTITADSVFEVNVLNPDTGERKAVTPSFTVTDEGFFISARDFTYSKPTIRVTPKPRPGKPTRVTVLASRKTLSTSFPRVTGTKYSVTATKAGVSKKLKCSRTKTRVNCSVRNLAKGTWRLSVIPTKNQVKGIAYTKRVKIK
jgi:hypothetical protein